ncbi:hypothetical protein Anapl_13867 [Anas platyrhynchos]|uniref:Uncharacterized protein n=1 Tax=Anas platyrhynchos TaxID=8839 RepID=R0LH21_ANAPL|nr:hypothetical protein Anapl_13867 [Anas platyrhynchos]
MWITQPRKIFGQESVYLGMLPKSKFQMMSYPMFQLCISSISALIVRVSTGLPSPASLTLVCCACFVPDPDLLAVLSLGAAPEGNTSHKAKHLVLGDTQRDPSQVDSHTLGQIMQRAHLASTALARELQAQTPVFLSFGRTANLSGILTPRAFADCLSEVNRRTILDNSRLHQNKHLGCLYLDHTAEGCQQNPSVLYSYSHVRENSQAVPTRGGCFPKRGKQACRDQPSEEHSAELGTRRPGDAACGAGRAPCAGHASSNALLHQKGVGSCKHCRQHLPYSQRYPACPVPRGKWSLLQAARFPTEDAAVAGMRRRAGAQDSHADTRSPSTRAAGQSSSDFSSFDGHGAHFDMLERDSPSGQSHPPAPAPPWTTSLLIYIGEESKQIKCLRTALQRDGRSVASGLDTLSARKLYATVENGNSKNNLLDSTSKGLTGITCERIDTVGTNLVEICMLQYWGKWETKGKSYPGLLGDAVPDSPGLMQRHSAGTFRGPEGQPRGESRASGCGTAARKPGLSRLHQGFFSEYLRIFLGAVRTCISLPSLAKAERQSPWGMLPPAQPIAPQCPIPPSHTMLRHGTKCQPLRAYEGVKAQGFLASTAGLNFVASKRGQALLHCPNESRFLATVFVVILPHPLSPFLSNNTFSTQGNHRQRKQNCEQELPHAYCQLE